MDTVGLAAFCCEAGFAYLSFGALGCRKAVSTARGLAAFGTLLLILLLDWAAAPLESGGAWLCFLGRVVFYGAYVVLAQGAPLGQAAYAGAYFAVMSTAIRGIFLAPAAAGLAAGTAVLTGVAGADILVCVLVVLGVQGLCYAAAWRLLPLGGAGTPTLLRGTAVLLTGAVSVCAAEYWAPGLGGGAAQAWYMAVQAGLVLFLWGSDGLLRWRAGAGRQP